MKVKGHHPIQEEIAKLLHGISGVPHLEASKMVSRVAGYARDEFVKLEAERDAAISWIHCYCCHLDTLDCVRDIKPNECHNAILAEVRRELEVKNES